MAVEGTQYAQTTPVTITPRGHCRPGGPTAPAYSTFAAASPSSDWPDWPADHAVRSLGRFLQVRARPWPSPGPMSAEQERIKALEREVRELRQANEILRKATAYLNGVDAPPDGITLCQGGDLQRYHARREHPRQTLAPSASTSQRGCSSCMERPPTDLWRSGRSFRMTGFCRFSLLNRAA